MADVVRAPPRRPDYTQAEIQLAKSRLANLSVRLDDAMTSDIAVVSMGPESSGTSKSIKDVCSFSDHVQRYQGPIGLNRPGNPQTKDILFTPIPSPPEGPAISIADLPSIPIDKLELESTARESWEVLRGIQAGTYRHKTPLTWGWHWMWTHRAVVPFRLVLWFFTTLYATCFPKPPKVPLVVLTVSLKPLAAVPNEGVGLRNQDPPIIEDPTKPTGFRLAESPAVQAVTQAITACKELILKSQTRLFLLTHTDVVGKSWWADGAERERMMDALVYELTDQYAGSLTVCVGPALDSEDRSEREEAEKDLAHLVTMLCDIVEEYSLRWRRGRLHTLGANLWHRWSKRFENPLTFLKCTVSDMIVLFFLYILVIYVHLGSGYILTDALPTLAFWTRDFVNGTVAWVSSLGAWVYKFMSPNGFSASGDGSSPDPAVVIHDET